jgi:DNA-binding FadR family transcriptional regulator
MDRPRVPRPNRAWRSTRVGTDELIQLQITAAGIACRRMTQPSLTALRNAVAEVGSLPAKPEWTRKAAAHTEIFRLLMDMSGDRPSDAIRTSNEFVREVIRASGPAADGMLTSSQRRLLRHLAGGDADSAELEVEKLLRVLHCMWRLATSGRDNHGGQLPGGWAAPSLRRQPPGKRLARSAGRGAC